MVQGARHPQLSREYHGVVIGPAATAAATPNLIPHRSRPQSTAPIQRILSKTSNTPTHLSVFVDGGGLGGDVEAAFLRAVAGLDRVSQPAAAAFDHRGRAAVVVVAFNQPNPPASKLLPENVTHDALG